MDADTADSCRLTLLGPDRRLDTSVPSGVVLADLMPALLVHLGPDLADRGLDHGGWVLQRPGESPLDENRSPLELGLYDGDVLHLRPRADLLPPIDFDDLVDGVATGMRRLSGLWRPEGTARATVGATGLVLLAALLVVAAPGDPVTRASTAWITAVLLLGYQFAVRRRRTARPFVVLAGIAAVAHAGLALTLTPSVVAGFGWPVRPWVVASAVAFAAAVTVAALVAAGTGPAVLTCLGGAFGWVLVVGGLLTATHGDRVSAAGVLLIGACVLRTVVPKVAFRIGGLRLDPLPGSAEDLQQDIDPEPGAQVLQAAAGVDRIMTALYAGLAAVSTWALAVLVAAPGWVPLSLAGCAALNTLLSLRPMTRIWHRLVLGVPATMGVLAVSVAGFLRSGPGATVLGHQTLLVAAVAVGLLGSAQAGRRLSPGLGRSGDWLQLLTIAATIPLALQPFGLYGLVRDWAA